MATYVGIALWALIPGFIAKKKGRSFWGYYFLSFVITPLITMIITMCLSNVKENTYIENVSLNASGNYRHCSKCGSKLIENSQFCSKCGTAITEK